jgi:isocitrate/isopropylmalate dehydrogenase
VPDELPIVPSLTMCRKVRTGDMGGNSSTNDFTRAVLGKMEAAA